MEKALAKFKNLNLGGLGKDKPEMGAICEGKDELEVGAISASTESIAKASIEQPKQSTVSEGHEKTTVSASSSSSLAAQAGPSEQANKEPTEAKSLLKMFGPAKTDDVMVKYDRTTKTSFLEADLIFPGIALKKVKQAMTSENATPQNYIAALGLTEVEMHRAKRDSVFKMVLADITQFRDSFWQHVSNHLHGQKIAAFLMAANNPLSTEDVSWLT